jgi:hypothetical protein
MTLSRIMISLAIALATTTLYASDQFFVVGKSYLFVPRLNMVMKGTVTQVTDHEIVFTDRSVLKASKVPASANNDDVKSGKIKSTAIADYLKSDKKESLLDSGPLRNVAVSYSRSEMTAIKLDS